MSQPPTQSESPVTESRNPASERIDTLDAAGIVNLMTAEDARMLDAVRAEQAAIAWAVERVALALRAGGRLIYVGAGTSGRLGVLDASECPPTFGTDPDQIVGVIAGGDTALRRSIEGAEDDVREGARVIDRIAVGRLDVVMGIATSGQTPYVLAAVDRARERGALTIGLACNRPCSLEAHVDCLIAPVVGPEIITGSTRLKAGTATKLVLNMITTGAMVLNGKTWGNRMIDLGPVNAKIRNRSQRILCELGNISTDEAARLLAQTSGRLKPALLMALANVSASESARLLDQHGGSLHRALHSTFNSQQQAGQQ